MSFIVLFAVNFFIYALGANGPKFDRKNLYESCLFFIFINVFVDFYQKMLYGRRKLRRRVNKSKINPTTVVHSDDIMLFDLMEQLIGLCCCSVLTYAYVDSSGIIQTQTTTTKSQTIEKNERQSKKFNRKNSILWLMVRRFQREQHPLWTW